jgi:hypothetical protein
MKKLKNQTKINEAFALAAGLIVIAGVSASAQTTIYFDPFNGSGNLDLATTAGITGVDSGAGGALPQNDTYVQTIDGFGDLVLNGGGTSGETGGVQFGTVGSPTTLYNWAASPGASAITAAGGMVVSFQWTPSTTTSGDWMWFNVGEDPGSGFGGAWSWNARIWSSKTANGILFADDGNVQTFDAGAGGKQNTTAFTPSAGATYNIVLDYGFSSWAAGSPVTLNALINGTPVLSDSFTWTSAEAGANYLGLGSYQTEVSDIKNFEIEAPAVVPEPSTWAMVLGGFGMLISSRRLRRG